MPRVDLAFKPAIGLYGQHDPSAALFVDGDLTFAVEEERLTREKHATDTFPERAIEACLDHQGIELAQVDSVRLPYDPSLRKKILPHYVRQALDEETFVQKGYHLQQLLVRELQAQFAPVKQIRGRLEAIGTPVPEIENFGHHACHAASAFHPSGFEEAVVLTIDAKGEYDSTAVWHGTPDGLERVRTYEHPNSLGLFYAAITEYLGYRMFNGEGKVMGLAPYGERDREIERDLRTLVDTGVDYDVTALVRKFSAANAVSRLAALFDRPPRDAPGEFSAFEKNLARVAQRLLEEIVVDVTEHYCDELGVRNVALAGGVALNCKLNQAIVESPVVDEVFVQPVAHDAGLALGAGWLDQPPADVPEFTHAYWGPAYETSAIVAELDTNKIPYHQPDDPERFVAEALADGDLVAWFQGRLELGPRALGNRSILADPRTTESKDRINRFVKHREEWRPFAPSMLEEATDEYLTTGRPDPFMITTSNVRDGKADEIPAVLHPRDETTRPQTVREEQNPRYYRLIEEFADVTGVPVVLNTSFNDNGEPIVNTPTEAVKDFFGMGLDVLVVEDVVVEKPGRATAAEGSQPQGSRG